MNKPLLTFGVILAITGWGMVAYCIINTQQVFAPICGIYSLIPAGIGTVLAYMGNVGASSSDNKTKGE